MRTLATTLGLFIFPLVTGCAATSADVSRNPSQAPLAPTTYAAIVVAAPSGVPFLGTVDVRANRLGNAADCQRRMLSEATKLGGDSVVIMYENGGKKGRGERCKGEVYRVSK